MDNLQKNKILALTQFSMLLAIEAIVSFTPLGSLPALGPIVMTLGMIPIAITGILLGIGPGAAMGAFAGIFSVCVWTFTPPPQSAIMAFVFTPFYSIGDMRGNFWSLVISIVPRVLVGVIAALVYRFMSKSFIAKEKNLVPVYMVAGACGSLANTVGVLGGIYLFFGRSYAQVWGFGYDLILLVIGGQVLTSGLPEAILCAVVAAAVCGPVKRVIAKVS